MKTISTLLLALLFTINVTAQEFTINVPDSLGEKAAREFVTATKEALIESGSIEEGTEIIVKRIEASSNAVTDAINQVSGAVENATDEISESAESGLMRQMYDDVSEAMKGMAKALAVGTEHLMKILVIQQLVYSIVYTIILLLGIWGFWYTFRFITKMFKDKEVGVDEVEGETSKKTAAAISVVAPLIFSVMSIICLAYGGSHLTELVTGYVNPEYGAIKEIFEFVKEMNVPESMKPTK